MQFAGRIGSLLLGVGEDPEAVETHLADKVEQLRKVGLRLARIAHQQGRAQRQVGNCPAQTADQLHRLGLRVAAVHGRKLGVGDMLEGDVEVFADLGFGSHHLDHVVGEGRRVGVVEADPRDPLDAAEAAQQLAEHAAPVEVDAVVGRILGDDDQLAHAGRGELPGFGFELLHRNRDVRPADERNGAVAALPVAALRDLQVGVVPGRRQQTLGLQRGILRGPQGVDDALPGAGAEVVVHLGNFGAQLVGIALREAADDEQMFDLSGALGRCGAQDHFDRLLLGVADEAAGVDDHGLGVRAVAVENDGIARGGQAGHQVLGIHGVLRTAEGDDVNLSHRRRVHGRIRGGRRCAAGRSPRRYLCNAPECETGR